MQYNIDNEIYVDTSISNDIVDNITSLQLEEQKLNNLDNEKNDEDENDDDIEKILSFDESTELVFFSNLILKIIII